MNIADLKKRLHVPEELFEKFLQGRGWSWHQLARGELPISFDDIQLGLICSDPVLWSEAFLFEPDTREPYRWWNYQHESVRDRSDVLHSDGAEVGKTREIGNLILWRAFTQEGSSSLVGAPEQVHLDDIIDYCNDQMFDLNPELGKGLKRHKKHPHHVFYFLNRSRVYLSPAGFDGTGFRGKHVDGLCIMEEAAKIKNPDVWNEFFRAAKPGCEIRIYSVPDGDRGTVYYRLKERAKGNAKTGVESDFAKDRKFRFYQWSKMQQPEPFWSEARRRFYIDVYGGEDSSGYKRNVLGEDGDPESAVFPWLQFSKCLKDIPDYRSLKVLVDNETVRLTGARYEVVYGENGQKAGKEGIIEDRTLDKAKFDIREILKGFFSPVPGLTFIGGDLGFSNDPTELIVRLVIGKTWRTVARLQLKGVSYDLQAEAINAFDDIFNPKGIGIDFGNAGSAVVHILQGQEHYKPKNYAERLTGFQFAEAFDDMDESGEAIIDKKTDKPRRKPAKELATDILVKKMQRQELEFPFDPDYVNQFPSQTYKEAARHIVYSKGNDHVIDAERVCTLKMIIPDVMSEDLFATGN